MFHVSLWLWYHMYIWMFHVSLTFVKVCSSTEPRGRTRRATNVSMVEFSCCWNHIYIDMIKSRTYCPVLSHLQKKQITYEKNCITLLIYSICLWKNDSLNVMDSKFIGVTWQNMGVQCIYLIYEIGCNPTQKKTLCTHAANILVLKVCHYKGNSMRTSSGIIFCVYV